MVPGQGNVTAACPKDKLEFFSSPAPISSFLRGKRRRLDAGFVMIRKLFELSYLTARAPKSHVQFRLFLREDKQYNVHMYSFTTVK